MKGYDSLGLGVVIFVGTGVVRSIVDEVDSDVGDKLGEGNKLEVGFEVNIGYVGSWRWDWLFIWHNCW